jgi:undecaprenyl diphosphate synthase
MDGFRRILSKNNIATIEFFDISFFIYLICAETMREEVILEVVSGLKKIDTIITRRIYKGVNVGVGEKISDILLDIENHVCRGCARNGFCGKDEVRKNIIVVKLFIIKYINTSIDKLFNDNEKTGIKELYDKGDIKKICEEFVYKLGVDDTNHFYYNVYLIIKEALRRRGFRNGLSGIEGSGRSLHIGLILDGNRRFAKKNELVNGHLFGSFNAIRIINYLYNGGYVKECTLYVLSYDNLIKRSLEEKDVIFGIIYSYLLELINYLVTCGNIYVQFIGEIDKMPENIRVRMNDIMQICGGKNIEECFVINYAIAYDGRREIYYSMKKHFLEGDGRESLSMMNDSSKMWLKRDIDFVIRSGGTQRMSSFFPWQTIYSEWYFLEKFWPEVTEEDILGIITNYKLKNMNFGA